MSMTAMKEGLLVGWSQKGQSFGEIGDFSQTEIGEKKISMWKEKMKKEI